MMPERTLIQKLDWILQAINDNKANEEIESAYNWNANELVEILEKLDRDGYIKRKQIPGSYAFSNTPTVEGRLFIGYEQQAVIDDRNERRIIRNEIWLIRGTWAAAIVGALVLFWQILTWHFPHYSDYPYHFFWETIPKRNP